MEGKSLSPIDAPRHSFSMPSSDIHGLPPIRSFGDLAKHAACEGWRLYRILEARSGAYSVFRIRKKAGGFRTIANPAPLLKRMQRWILSSILDELHTPACSFGFSRGSRLRDHAAQHRDARAILVFDIEGFFPSISTAQVTRVFAAAGYASRASSMLARLCTHLGALPQGAPSSPKLASLVCYRMDRRLSRFAESQGLLYTRYADDLTFSAASASTLAIARPFIAHIIRDCGFRLNQRKTRLLGPRRALAVTGLIVGPDKIGIGRRRLRELRARIHRSRESASPAELDAIQGWLDFVGDVDRDRYQILARYIHQLCLAGASGLTSLRVRDVSVLPR
jgi:RNA-directed DNA polymerase